MSQFCAVADLAAFLQIVIPENNASAVRAIAAASAAIQGHTRQQLEAVADDVVLLDSVGADRLILPEVPVTAVSAVTEDGALLDPSAYKWSRAGILYRLFGRWRAGIQIVAVTYSHGYAVTPGDVIDVCVRAAARTYQAGLRAAATDGVAGLQSEQLADHNVGFESAGGAGREWMLGASAAPMLLRSEQEVLNRYRMSR